MGNEKPGRVNGEERRSGTDRRKGERRDFERNTQAGVLTTRKGERRKNERRKSEPNKT
ncbi:MAG TPA: hypothetical protein VNN73_11645 [Blastocatellia bacterium]|nr:hypothetical protein [Blastocatellia bacterium]